MRAWLITWESNSESAEVADEIAAILPPRWSSERVGATMEQLYALWSSNLRELAAYAKTPNANPYRVTSVDNHADMLVCGAHPWLYGRKVSDFKVAVNPSGFETASWREPDRYRMKPDQTGIELAQRGLLSSVVRIVRGPLSQESVWDRAVGRRKPQVVAPNDSGT
jgi:hypothetical protein